MPGRDLLLLTGCVERRLTINTEPQGAIVTLNDQGDRGLAGDGAVQLVRRLLGPDRKDGYETLNTHRKLKSPLYDHPPLDFFAEILYPGRIVNAYEWTFDLAVKQYPSRDELIEQGQSLHTRTP